MTSESLFPMAPAPRLPSERDTDTQRPRSPLVRAASPGAAVEDSPPASGAVSGDLRGGR
jgi:hypothetical protein